MRAGVPTPISERDSNGCSGGVASIPAACIAALANKLHRVNVEVGQFNSAVGNYSTGRSQYPASKARACRRPLFVCVCVGYTVFVDMCCPLLRNFRTRSAPRQRRCLRASADYCCHCSACSRAGVDVVAGCVFFIFSGSTCSTAARSRCSRACGTSCPLCPPGPACASSTTKATWSEHGCSTAVVGVE